MSGLKGRIGILERKSPPLAPETRPPLTDEERLELREKLVEECEEEKRTGAVPPRKPGDSGLTPCQRLELIRQLEAEYLEEESGE